MQYHHTQCAERSLSPTVQRKVVKNAAGQIGRTRKPNVELMKFVKNPTEKAKIQILDLVPKISAGF